MLAYLPPLFFLAVLMGSPVPGFLVFMLLGGWHAWQSWRQPQGAHAFHWTREDTWLALCFMSIPLFKALTAMWSSSPQLALANAASHGYFLFWPLVLIGLDKSKGSTQNLVDRALALGLITVTLWRITFQLTGLTWLDHGSPNRGILAQLAMVVGSWNLLALTRECNKHSRWKYVYLFAALSTFLLLIQTERRLELMGFVLITTLILVWRWKEHLNFPKLASLLLAVISFMGILVYLRWQLFAKGLKEITDYLNTPVGQYDLANSSWGSRLEMWRLGWSAFLEKPWFGLSASAQPSSMQAWGGPPAEIFGHRHFHGQWLQILVEGGLVGASLAGLTTGWIVTRLILKKIGTHQESALLSATLLSAYGVEGLASAALHYDKPNAFFVVASAWLWLNLRSKTPAKTSNVQS